MPSCNSIRTRLVNILRTKLTPLDIEPIQDLPMSDIGLDSLDKWELLASVEREFDIDLGWTALKQVSTIRDLYDAVATALDIKSESV